MVSRTLLFPFVVEDPDSSEDEDELPQGEEAIPPMDYNNLIWEVFIEPMEDDDRLFRRAKFLCRQGKLTGCRMGRSDKVSLWYVALLIIKNVEL